MRGRRSSAVSRLWRVREPPTGHHDAEDGGGEGGAVGPAAAAAFAVRLDADGVPRAPGASLRRLPQPLPQAAAEVQRPAR